MNKKEPVITISIAAKLLELHTRTLMNYEKAGLIKPHRTKTKRRLYSFSDLQTLQFIKYLTQKEGVNLKGANIILNACRVGEKQEIKLKKLLFPAFKTKPLI